MTTRQSGCRKSQNRKAAIVVWWICTALQILIAIELCRIMIVGVLS